MQSKLTLLLDKELVTMETPLKAVEFKIVTIDEDLSDRHFRQIAEGAAILTRKTDFHDRVKELDCDVILLKEHITIEKDNTAMNRLAENIASAARESAFYVKRGNWLLEISEDGVWSLKEIVI